MAPMSKFYTNFSTNTEMYTNFYKKFYEFVMHLGQEIVFLYTEKNRLMDL